jgi:hypothetical protein
MLSAICRTWIETAGWLRCSTSAAGKNCQAGDGGKGFELPESQMAARHV